VLNDPLTAFALDDDGTTGSPLLWVGAPNVLAVARKLGDKYLLVTSIQQRMSNNARNLRSMVESRGKGRRWEVRLPGVVSPITVYARPQGSVYVITNASSLHPGVTQLDECVVVAPGGHTARRMARGQPSDAVELRAGRRA
jgi:uncharacterized protein involved in type VI secretion and phage assembly